MTDWDGMFDGFSGASGFETIHRRRRNSGDANGASWSVPGYRAIAGLVQYPNAQVANGSSFTQYQGRKSFYSYKSGVTKLVFQFTNSLSNIIGDFTLPDAMCKFSVFDPATSTYYPITIGGQSTIVAKSGQVFNTDPVTIPSISGAVRTGAKKLFLIKLIKWASAPSYFPGNAVVCTGQDYNEWGTNLTDKTASGAFTAAFVSQADIFPATCILGNVNDGTPVVAILGNSITSDAVGSPALDYVRGWAMYAMNDLGIPYVNIGTSSLSLNTFMSVAYASQRPRMLQCLVAAGVTHVLCSLSSGDLANFVSRSAHLANLLAFKALLDTYKIKLIPTIPTPRTDPTNTTEREAGSWALLDTYITDIVANNGVGYGYYDERVSCSDGVNSHLYRNDLVQAATLTVANGGSGYANNDILYMSNGVRARVSTNTGGVVNTVSIRSNGGWSSGAPPASITQVDSMSNALVGGPSGSGLVLNFTGSAQAFPSQEGIHPTEVEQAIQRYQLVSAIQGGLLL